MNYRQRLSLKPILTLTLTLTLTYLLTYLLTVRQWTPAMCHHHPGAQTENRQNATQYICAE
jgi:hypothetical protein